MSWEKDLRPASLSGIQFGVKASKIQGGRKLKDGRDGDEEGIPGILDEGIEIKKFDIQAFILGSDYLKKKIDLIKEIEKPGVKDLVHPFYGRVKVKVGNIDISETDSELGICRINFQAWRFSPLKYPFSENDKVGQIELTQIEVDNAIKEDFSNNFSIKGLPQNLKDSALSMINEAADLYEDMTSSIKEWSDTIGEAVLAARQIKAKAKDLIESPLALIENIQRNLDLAKNFSFSSKELFEAYRNTDKYGRKKKEVLSVTRTREQEEENTKQMTIAVRCSGISRACVQAVKMAEENSIETSQEARKMKEQVMSSLDEIMEQTTSPIVYSSLQKLRTQFLEAVPGNSNRLPNLSTYELEHTTNSIMLSYEIYGTTDLERDIIQRNEIEDPMFITPKELEIKIL
ncbi:DNA circularization N-terminal domain-containing protein [Halobacteriovorax sp. GB3]|uniref:DNA circularization N-terminal domain-containing protein n=1 Tax=Halobacteriovorax sp. GB3 TaxID=2719615 RepID=UPI0023623AF7|nr:DNA circularization N-terminal domain-containing protein [Halobacteriovorax sp. GB3]MDD0852998.1 DNA circularization N-terminal domain-containing protein [Halobacteriovorax sp. GB3]